ncbi:MAG: nucleotidyltransferase family protein [Prevotella sp.]
MDIIERNFMRLLRSGTFGDNEIAEPMSHWKWRRLFQMSLMHGVSALVYDGIKKRSDELYVNIPYDLRLLWQQNTKEIETENHRVNNLTAELFQIFKKEQLRPIILKGQAIALLYPNPDHRTGGDCDIFFPYEPQALKADAWAQENGKVAEGQDRYTVPYTWKGMAVENHHRMQRLTNVWLNKRLQSIIESEIRCCDSSYVNIDDTRIETLPPTLNLLIEITRIARYILNDGVRLKQLIDLGMMLRTIGAKVDFVKLQEWINRLHLQRIATLEASLLIELFGFSEDELPFFMSRYASDITYIAEELLQFDSTHSDEWYFTQGKNIFVKSNNSKAMLWQVKHSFRYFKFYPTEMTTNFIKNFAHSLSHIEE